LQSNSKNWLLSFQETPTRRKKKRKDFPHSAIARKLNDLDTQLRLRAAAIDNVQNVGLNLHCLKKFFTRWVGDPNTQLPTDGRRRYGAKVRSQHGDDTSPPGTCETCAK
jgi:hypothetical protein